jgi:hypothetical protein
MQRRIEVDEHACGWATIKRAEILRHDEKLHLDDIGHPRVRDFRETGCEACDADTSEPVRIPGEKHEKALPLGPRTVGGAPDQAPWHLLNELAGIAKPLVHRLLVLGAERKKGDAIARREARDELGDGPASSMVRVETGWEGRHEEDLATSGQSETDSGTGHKQAVPRGFKRGGEAHPNDGRPADTTRLSLRRDGSDSAVVRG